VLNNCGDIQKFEVVFTHNKRNGHIKVLLTQNYIYSCNGEARIMYQTNFKIGSDVH
jgi:hypothetical protein